GREHGNRACDRGSGRFDRHQNTGRQGSRCCYNWYLPHRTALLLIEWTQHIKAQEVRVFVPKNAHAPAFRIFRSSLSEYLNQGNTKTKGFRHLVLQPGAPTIEVDMTIARRLRGQES